MAKLLKGIKLMNSERWLDVRSIYKESIDTVQVTFEVNTLAARKD